MTHDEAERLRRRAQRRARTLFKVIALDDGSPGAAVVMLHEVVRMSRAVNALVAARLDDRQP